MASESPPPQDSISPPSPKREEVKVLHGFGLWDSDLDTSSMDGEDEAESEAVEVAAANSPSALSCGSDKVSVWGDGHGKSTSSRLAKQMLTVFFLRRRA